MKFHYEIKIFLYFYIRVFSLYLSLVFFSLQNFEMIFRFANANHKNKTRSISLKSKEEKGNRGLLQMHWVEGDKITKLVTNWRSMESPRIWELDRTRESRTYSRDIVVIMIIGEPGIWRVQSIYYFSLVE